AHLLYAAGHDPLTGLANRALLQDRLRGIMARVRREHARFAVLYLDLDKFKSVNDRFGHAIGDLMLQEVARRLRDCIRESDTIARMGGDEFVVLLDNLLLPVHAQAVARKIQAAFDAPFRLGNEHNSIVGRISVSIGIAVYPDNGEDEGALLQYADNHMFASKQRDQADLEAVR